MSEEFDDKIAQSLDRVLGQGLGLGLNRAWHPDQVLFRRRRRRWAIGGAGMAASLLALALPIWPALHEAHQSSQQVSYLARQVPDTVQAILRRLGDGSATVDGMSPVYASYPVAVPTGQNYAFSGHFSWQGLSATAVSIQINMKHQVLGGVLFAQGEPIYTFSGGHLNQGKTIAPPSPPTVLQGTWIKGGAGAIDAFSAAGSHVYLTRRNLWANLTGGNTTSWWAKSPGSPPSVVSDTIAALPAHPEQAVLVEESPSGQSKGFVTQNGGRTWTPWRMGTVSVSNLIAIGTRYWAIVKGTLATSLTGKTFTPVLSLNTRRWQVQSFAVNPSNPDMVVVALIPISGDGIGPVLETRDGGRHWYVLPNFPALGAAPAVMAMSASGSIAALINLSEPVLLTYQPASRQWSLLPVPNEGRQTGVGALAEDPAGDLIYGAPGGLIYEWERTGKLWQVIPLPSQVTPSSDPATPLQSIGNQQILAGYASGWYIFYHRPLSSVPATTAATATPLR